MSSTLDRGLVSPAVSRCMQNYRDAWTNGCQSPTRVNVPAKDFSSPSRSFRSYNTPPRAAPTPVALREASSASSSRFNRERWGDEWMTESARSAAEAITKEHRSRLGDGAAVTQDHFVTDPDSLVTNTEHCRGYGTNTGFGSPADVPLARPAKLAAQQAYRDEWTTMCAAATADNYLRDEKYGGAPHRSPVVSGVSSEEDYAQLWTEKCAAAAEEARAVESPQYIRESDASAIKAAAVKRSMSGLSLALEDDAHAPAPPDKLPSPVLETGPAQLQETIAEAMAAKAAATAGNLGTSPVTVLEMPEDNLARGLLL